MDELNTTAQEQENENNNNALYLKAIQDLKASTVKREEYERLQEDNKNLLDALINGKSTATAETAHEERPSSSELKQRLFKPEKPLTDIEYVKRTLEFRDRLLEETGEDCFVSKSHINPDAKPEEQAQKAQQVADVLRQCVDQSNGNDQLFHANLGTRLNDVYLPTRKR